MLKNKVKDLLSRYLYLDKYWIQYSIIFGLVIIIALLFPKGKSLKYSYQLNDVTRSPIIAPFTYPILKSQDKLNLDLEETKKAIPYVFNRNIKIVENQTKAIEEFFSFVGLLRSASSRLNESKRLVYERRYHKQYEKARSEFVSDSTKYAILNSDFRLTYPFVSLKNDWNSYIQIDIDLKSSNDIKRNKENIIDNLDFINISTLQDMKAWIFSESSKFIPEDYEYKMIDDRMDLVVKYTINKMKKELFKYQTFFR